MSPAMPSPVLMPVWTSSADVGARACSLYSRTRRRISIAALTAARGASSIASGTPNSAITQSPRYFSTVPPCLRAISSRSCRQPTTIG